MTNYIIKSIRDLPMGDIEFRTLESLEQYFKSDLAEQEGNYFYRKNGLLNPVGALILFRYKSKIRAFGIIKDVMNKNNKYEDFIINRNKFVEEKQRKFYNGSLIFDINTVQWLEHPIEKYELNLLTGCSKIRFSQAPNKYNIKCLKDLIDLLQNRIKVKNEYLIDKNNKLEIRRRKAGKGNNDRQTTRKAVPETKISHVHEMMKEILIKYLSKDYEEKQIDTEKDYIDILIKKGKKILLYEIKTHFKPEKCIRNALGQLLYYEWTQKVEGKNKNIDPKLTVFGLYKSDYTANEFLKYINKKFKVYYECLEELMSLREFETFITEKLS